MPDQALTDEHRAALAGYRALYHQATQALFHIGYQATTKDECVTSAREALMEMNHMPDTTEEL